jgi:hypothetical protein
VLDLPGPGLYSVTASVDGESPCFSAEEIDLAPPEDYPPLPPDLNPGLSAILECVAELEDGELLARFGYENREPFGFTIPIGSDNRLVGRVLETDGPVTEFGHPNVVPGRPGRTPFGEGVFTVRFPDDGQIVWVLHGKTATASSGSARCDS